jgi:thioredoxin-like negative regulator of GroEL
MSEITEITSVAQWESIQESASPNTLLIAVFYAPQSASCAQLTTHLSTLATENEYATAGLTSTRWVCINVEQLIDLGEAYNVTSVPLMVLLRDGKVLEKVASSDMAKLRTAIDAHNQMGGATVTHSGPTGTNSHLANASGASEEPPTEDASRLQC